MKNIFILILLSSFMASYSQERKLSIMAGYKAIEFGATYTDKETELIYGLSASIVDSKVSEKRANTNDKGKIHNFKSDVVPALFGQIGAKFNSLSIIGKIGSAYVNQTINSKSESQKMYLAFGVIIDQEISENIGLCFGYDSVNAVQLGVSIKL